MNEEDAYYFNRRDGFVLPADRDGSSEKSYYVTEMPAFPDLYRQVHGRLPAGPDWHALNWSTNQTGDDLCRLRAAPRGTPSARSRRCA